jgi:hypothetical protein
MLFGEAFSPKSLTKERPPSSAWSTKSDVQAMPAARAT